MTNNTPKRRLLVLGCSATKRPNWSAPAVELYDGPAFRTYRAWRDANPAAAAEVEVVVLSAEYGLVYGSTTIATYDRRMTDERALELAPSVRPGWERLAATFDDVFVFAGLTYRETCLRFGETRQAMPHIRKAEGSGIGHMLADLKRWLNEGVQA